MYNKYWRKGSGKMKKKYLIVLLPVVLCILLLFSAVLVKHRSNYSLNGSYQDEKNRFTNLSFDSSKKKYYYTIFEESYTGDYEYSNKNNEGEIYNGELKGYSVKVLNKKEIELEKDSHKLIFTKISSTPSIISQDKE